MSIERLAMSIFWLAMIGLVVILAGNLIGKASNKV